MPAARRSKLLELGWKLHRWVFSPIRVRSRVAEVVERYGLWERIIGRDPSYAEYQSRTDRLIPVVVLDRM